ncbi:MAG TPA: hypothetical protein VJZ03_02220 [Candidatus Bathyarchaeia archaeon]|nr:hypothetical protein [Candidatus Bathyarchaeia archaeon]
MRPPQSVLNWLLEPGQPAVRYHTLLRLLDRCEDDWEVRSAYSRIPRIGWAYNILASQKPGGFWESRKDLYRPKYTATIWRLIVLADLGLTAKDARIRRPCEFFLNEYARSDGGFDDSTSPLSRSEVCLTGNLARTLVPCGYVNDARVRAAYDWFVDHQMEDGGWHCFVEQAGGRGTLDCWEALSAYSVLPRRKWTRRIKRSVERGAEFYLERRLFQYGRRYTPWFRFHYPVHYYYDVLVGLDVLSSLGYADDKRLKPALEILDSERRIDGTWSLDRIHPDLGTGADYKLKKRAKRFALERENQPSKWITLTALSVLKRVDEVS